MAKTIYKEKYLKLIDRLKQARSEANLKQIDVALLLNKPQSYISKIESGERRLDVIEMMDFAKIYKKKCENFLS
ncbi:MAG: helix-turn-helix transcriptional regulator [Candidatus Margulisbacteria bacterium]|nr:helix-turn-helix transcriptional regulator [Candidatus Margulisiibacteriota bacterium]